MKVSLAETNYFKEMLKDNGNKTSKSFNLFKIIGKLDR